MNLNNKLRINLNIYIELKGRDVKYFTTINIVDMKKQIDDLINN